MPCPGFSIYKPPATFSPDVLPSRTVLEGKQKKRDECRDELIESISMEENWIWRCLLVLAATGYRLQCAQAAETTGVKVFNGAGRNVV
jgi:hypothetical protein